jgi:hypothetical protein
MEIRVHNRHFGFLNPSSVEYIYWTMSDGTPQWAVTPAQQQQQQYQGYPPQQQPGHPPPPQQHMPQLQQRSAAPPQAPASGGAHVVSPPASGDVSKMNKFNRIAQMEDKVLMTRTRDEETEDGRLCNKEAMTKIRDAWVYKRVRSRAKEFTEYKQVRSFEDLFSFRRFIFAYSD